MVATVTRQTPEGTWMGEFHNSDGDSIGSVWRVATGKYRVCKVEYGKVIAAMPGVFTGAAFRKAGGLRISAGQSVSFWAFK